MITRIQNTTYEMYYPGQGPSLGQYIRNRVYPGGARRGRPYAQQLRGKYKGHMLEILNTSYRGYIAVMNLHTGTEYRLLPSSLRFIDIEYKSMAMPEVCEYLKTRCGLLGSNKFYEFKKSLGI